MCAPRPFDLVDRVRRIHAFGRLPIDRRDDVPCGDPCPKGRCVHERAYDCEGLGLGMGFHDESDATELLVQMFFKFGQSIRIDKRGVFVKTTHHPIHRRVKEVSTRGGLQGLLFDNRHRAADGGGIAILLCRSVAGKADDCGEENRNEVAVGHERKSSRRNGWRVQMSRRWKAPLQKVDLHLGCLTSARNVTDRQRSHYTFTSLRRKTVGTLS